MAVSSYDIVILADENMESRTESETEVVVISEMAVASRTSSGSVEGRLIYNGVTTDSVTGDIVADNDNHSTLAITAVSGLGSSDGRTKVVSAASRVSSDKQRSLAVKAPNGS